MPNNYLSLLYKHIIQVENKNVGLKVCVCGGGGGGGAQTYHSPHASYASDIYIYIYIWIKSFNSINSGAHNSDLFSLYLVLLHAFRTQSLCVSYNLLLIHVK